MTSPFKYAKNLGKSLVEGTRQIVKELMPEASETYVKSSEVMGSTWNSIKDFKRIQTKFGDSFIAKATAEAMDSIKKGVSTGEFVRKERSSADGDMDTGMGGTDEFDSYFADQDDSGAQQEAETPGAKNFFIKNVNGADPGAVSRGVAASVLPAAKAQITANMMGTAKLLGAMEGMTGGIMSIAEFNAGPFSRFIEESGKMYSIVSEALTKITENMDLMVESKKRMKDGSSGGGFTSIFEDLGGDPAAYFQKVMGRSKNELLPLIGMSPADLTDLVKYSVGEPLGSAVKATLKAIIPKSMKDSMKSFSSMLGDIPMLFMRSMNTMRSSNNPIFSWLGKLMGGDISNKDVSVGEYEKGEIPFDGITKRAIVNVIPSLLGKILSALTGREETVYDYDKGGFSNKSKAREDLRSKLRPGDIRFNEDGKSLQEEILESLGLKDEKSKKEAKAKLELAASRLTDKDSLYDGENDTEELSGDPDLDMKIRERVKRMSNKEKAAFNRSLTENARNRNDSIRSAQNSGGLGSVFDDADLDGNNKTVAVSDLFDKSKQLTASKEATLGLLGEMTLLRKVAEEIRDCVCGGKKKKKAPSSVPIVPSPKPSGPDADPDTPASPSDPSEDPSVPSAPQPPPAQRTAWQRMMGVLQNPLKSFGAALNKASDFIGSVFFQTKEWRAKLGESFKKMWGNMKEFGSKIWGSVKDLGLKLWTNMGGPEFVAKVKETSSKSWAWIKKTSSEVFAKTKEFSAKSWNSFKGWASGVWEKTKETFSKAFSGVGTFLKTSWGKMVGFAKNSVFLPMKAKLEGAFTWLKKDVLAPWTDKLFGAKGEDGKRTGGVIADWSAKVKTGFIKALDRFSGVFDSLKTKLAVGIKQVSESFKTQAERLQTYLFGEKGENGERLGGKMSPEAQMMMKGAGIGGVAGYLFGGPVVGAALGLVLSSEKVRTYLFGPEGLVKRAWTKVSTIATTQIDKTKNWLFGEKDEEGKRKGGAMNRFMDRFQRGFMELKDKAKVFLFGDGKEKKGFLTEGARIFQESIWKPMVAGSKRMVSQVQKGFMDNVITPLKGTLSPFVEELKFQIKLLGKTIKDFAVTQFKNLMGAAKAGLSAVFESSVGKPFGQLMEEKFLKPMRDQFSKMKDFLIKKVFGFLGNVTGAIRRKGISLAQAQLARAKTPEEIAAAQNRLSALTAPPDKKMGETATSGMPGDKKQGFFSKLFGGGSKKDASGGSPAAISTAGMNPVEKSAAASTAAAEKVQSLTDTLKAADLPKLSASSQESAVEAKKGNSFLSRISDLVVGVKDRISEYLGGGGKDKASGGMFGGGGGPESDISAMRSSMEDNASNVSDIRDDVAAIRDILGGKEGATGSSAKPRGIFGKLLGVVTAPFKFVKNVLGSKMFSNILAGLTAPLKLLPGLASAAGKAFSALTSVAGSLIKGMGALVEGAAKVAGGLLSLASKALPMLADLFSNLTKAIGPVLSGLANLAGSLVTGLTGLASKVVEGSVRLLGTSVKALGTLAGGLGKAMGGMFSMIGKVAGPLAKLLGPMLSGLFKGVSSFFGGTLGRMFKKKVQEVYVVGGTLDKVKEIDKMGKRGKPGAPDMDGLDLKMGIRDKMQSAWTGAKNIGTKVKDWYFGKGKSMKDWRLKNTAGYRVGNEGYSKLKQGLSSIEAGKGFEATKESIGKAKDRAVALKDKIANAKWAKGTYTAVTGMFKQGSRLWGLLSMAVPFIGIAFKKLMSPLTLISAGLGKLAGIKAKAAGAMTSLSGFAMKAPDKIKSLLGAINATKAGGFVAEKSTKALSKAKGAAALLRGAFSGLGATLAKKFPGVGGLSKGAKGAAGSLLTKLKNAFSVIGKSKLVQKFLGAKGGAVIQKVGTEVVESAVKKGGPTLLGKILATLNPIGLPIKLGLASWATWRGYRKSKEWLGVSNWQAKASGAMGGLLSDLLTFGLLPASIPAGMVYSMIKPPPPKEPAIPTDKTADSKANDLSKGEEKAVAEDGKEETKSILAKGLSLLNPLGQAKMVWSGAKKAFGLSKAAAGWAVGKFRDRMKKMLGSSIVGRIIGKDRQKAILENFLPELEKRVVAAGPSFGLRLMAKLTPLGLPITAAQVGMGAAKGLWNAKTWLGEGGSGAREAAMLGSGLSSGLFGGIVPPDVMSQMVFHALQGRKSVSQTLTPAPKTDDKAAAKAELVSVTPPGGDVKRRAIEAAKEKGGVAASEAQQKKRHATQDATQDAMLQVLMEIRDAVARGANASETLAKEGIQISIPEVQSQKPNQGNAEQRNFFVDAADGRESRPPMTLIPSRIGRIAAGV